MNDPTTPMDAYKAIIDQLLNETRRLGSSDHVAESSIFSKWRIIASSTISSDRLTGLNGSFWPACCKRSVMGRSTTYLRRPGGGGGGSSHAGSA